VQKCSGGSWEVSIWKNPSSLVIIANKIWAIFNWIGKIHLRFAQLLGLKREFAVLAVWGSF